MILDRIISVSNTLNHLTVGKQMSYNSFRNVTYKLFAYRSLHTNTYTIYIYIYIYIGFDIK